MKKLIYILLFFASISSSAQEIGLRFGEINGGNVAIDAVISAGELGRLHTDISFNKGVGIDLIWDFVYQPLDGENLHWYLGAGPYAFLGDPFALGAVGEVGLEYVFKKSPFVIGIDWRPYFRIIDNTNVGVETYGINLRYKF